jgi:hypothetical protein
VLLRVIEAIEQRFLRVSQLLQRRAGAALAAVAVGLFPFERVFEAADGVLNLALYLVSLALRLQLGVTDHLADHLLDCTFDLLRRSDDPVLVHDFFLLMPLANPTEPWTRLTIAARTNSRH